MPKRKSSKSSKSVIISIFISLLGLLSGMVLVNRRQIFKSSAEVYTQPLLYFTPTEVTVPVNSEGKLYDIIIDTAGYEVNGAIFEINYDTDVIQITDIQEGEVLSQVVSKSVSGDSAYLTVVLADETKPFVGQGIVATVEFNTYDTPTTTELVFGNNTQIHTKTTTGGLPEDTPPGYINITSQPQLSPTPTPTMTPTPTITPVLTATPTPTIPPETASVSIFPEEATTQADDIIPVSVNIDYATDSVSEISITAYHVPDFRNPDLNIMNILIDPFYTNAYGWYCTTTDPYYEGEVTYFGATCKSANSENYLTADNTSFLSFDLQGLGITYSVPIAIKIDPTRSYLRDSQGNYFSTDLTSTANYYFCGTDFNNDGKSTGNDYAAWAYYFDPFNPVSGGPAVGDYNCDEYVNANDFALWSYNFTPY